MSFSFLDPRSAGSDYAAMRPAPVLPLGLHGYCLFYSLYCSAAQQYGPQETTEPLHGCEWQIHI